MIEVIDKIKNYLVNLNKISNDVCIRKRKINLIDEIIFIIFI